MLAVSHRDHRLHADADRLGVNRRMKNRSARRAPSADERAQGKSTERSRSAGPILCSRFVRSHTVLKSVRNQSGRVSTVGPLEGDSH